jgi:hypothetical protein
MEKLMPTFRFCVKNNPTGSWKVAWSGSHYTLMFQHCLAEIIVMDLLSHLLVQLEVA